MKQCWGAESVAAANDTKNTLEAYASITSLVLKTGSIIAIFERIEKSKVIYLHQQYTKTEAKFVTPQ